MRRGIHLSPTALRLASLVADGGRFYDADLVKALTTHRNVYTRALEELRHAGAITYGSVKRGPHPGPRRITPDPAHWVWSIPGVRERRHNGGAR